MPDGFQEGGVGRLKAETSLDAFSKLLHGKKGGATPTLREWLHETDICKICPQRKEAVGQLRAWSAKASVRMEDPSIIVDLEDFISFEGPAVAAMAAEGAALFTHDPRRGARSWQRFQITHLPRAPRSSVGGISAAQQREALALLTELATEPTLAAPTTEPVAADPTDQLASWLLGQAGLTGTPNA
jgi:hypothetical protein